MCTACIDRAVHRFYAASPSSLHRRGLAGNPAVGNRCLSRFWGSILPLFSSFSAVTFSLLLRSLKGSWRRLRKSAQLYTHPKCQMELLLLGSLRHLAIEIGGNRREVMEGGEIQLTMQLGGGLGEATEPRARSSTVHTQMCRQVTPTSANRPHTSGDPFSNHSFSEARYQPPHDYQIRWYRTHGAEHAALSG